MIPTVPPSYCSFQLKYGSIEKEFMVPEHVYQNYYYLREEFNSAVDEPFPSSPAELMAKFLGFVASKVDPNELSPASYVLKFVLTEFQVTYLMGLDIHELASSLINGDVNSIASGKVKENLIKNYYTALVNSNSEIVASHYILNSGAFKTKYAVCFGQGNINYFALLIELHTLYGAFINTDFLVPICEAVKFQNEEYTNMYPQGLDFVDWLENPEKRPNQSYLLSAAVSCPLIAVTQLAHCKVMIKIMGLTPGEYGKYFLAGATGHGQGIVTSLAIALSGSWESFLQNAIKAVHLMVSIGAQTGLKFPRASVGVQSGLEIDYLTVCEGLPTSMLLIRDLSLQQVEAFITQTNKGLPETQHVAISLFNGPTNFGICGAAESLYALVLILKENKATKVLQQVPVQETVSKSRFLDKFGSFFITSDTNRLKQDSKPQEKLKFSCMFVPIFAPFHSHLLKDIYELIVQDINNLGIEFSSKDIRLPVYDTHNGANLQEYDITPQEYPLTSRLIKLIIELPVNWETAAKFRSTAVTEFGQKDVFGLLEKIDN